MQVRPLLLGHRGSKSIRSIPENTPAAFDVSLQDGCDGFEFDVRCTRDGHAVICHDPRSRGALIAQSKRSTLPDLPALEDVLAQYSTRAFLDIELKTRGLTQTVLRRLREYPPSCGFVISSFLREVLLDVRAHNKSIPLGIIFERRVPRWRQLPVDYLIAEKSLVTRTLLQDAHKAGKKLFAWTVNDKAAMVRLAGLGVDGIISDKTKLLVETLGDGRQAQ